jgi:hypothetical protein
MKKHLLKFSLILSIGGVVYFTSVGLTNAYETGAPSGCSYSPYDENNFTGDCSGCHTQVLTQQNWISSNIPLTGYIPGVTYTITCKAVDKASGHNSSFGFECTPQNQKTGAVVGTLGNITTSGTGATQILSSEWMTQTSGSYKSTDSNKWSFTWKAPSPGKGAVNFYACFNCGSVTSSGSAQIYWDSLHYKQGSTVGIEQITNVASEINVYPNPIKDVFNVSYELQNSKQVEINLYSIDGKQVANLLSGDEQTVGEHNHTLRIPLITPGIYLLQVIQGEQVSYKKVVVER